MLQTGLVSAPAEFVLTERPHPEWTVAEANVVMHARKTDWDAARALAACASLSASWKTSLAKRAETRAFASSAKRLNDEG